MVLFFKNLLNFSGRVINLKKNLDLKILQGHITKEEPSFLEGDSNPSIICPNLEARTALSSNYGFVLGHCKEIG